MRTTTLVVLCVLLIACSFAVAAPAQAGWFDWVDNVADFYESVQDGVAGALQWLWDKITDLWEKEVPGLYIGSLVPVIQMIGSDSTSWTNLADVDTQCMIRKLLKNVDESQWSPPCRNCYNSRLQCQECMDSLSSALRSTLYEVIVKGECRRSSNGYDLAITGASMHPARPIGGQTFELEIGADSVGPDNIHIWSGGVSIFNKDTHALVLQEPVSAERGTMVRVNSRSGNEFQSQTLDEGTYTVAITAAHIYKQTGIIRRTLEEITDSNLANNILQFDLVVAPNPPTDPVTLSSTGNVPYVTLSWAPYQTNDFHRYEIHRSTAQAFTPRDEPPSTKIDTLLRSDQTTYEDLFGQPNVRFFYKVRVCDVAERCAASNEVSATRRLPPNFIVLQPPEGINPDSMTLTWNENSDENFSRYELHQSTTAGFTPSRTTRVFTSDQRAVTSHRITGLTIDTTYSFRVRVCNVFDVCVDSNEVSGFTRERSAPIAYIDQLSPQTVRGYGDQLITFKGHGFDTDGSVTSYTLTSGRDGDVRKRESQSMVQDKASGRHFTVTIRQELSTGIHTIAFVVRDNDGKLSEPVTTTLTVLKPTPRAVIPESPYRDISYATQPVYSWQKVTLDMAGQPIAGTRYEMQIASDAAFAQVIHHEEQINALTHKTTTALANGTYYWRVRAVSDGLAGPWSQATRFTIAMTDTTPLSSGEKPPTLNATFLPETIIEGQPQTIRFEMKNNAQRTLVIQGATIRWYWDQGQGFVLSEVQAIPKMNEHWITTEVPASVTRAVYIETSNGSGRGQWRGEVLVSTNLGDLTGTILHTIQ